MNSFIKELRVGDVVSVKSTGNRLRKVVSIHDKYAMVERQYFYQQQSGPAKVWFKSITRNHSADERYEKECEWEDIVTEFWDNIEEFREIIKSMMLI